MNAMSSGVLDARAAFDGLLGLDPAGCSVTVCLASGGKAVALTRYERLQITEALADVFRGVVTLALTRYRKERDGGSLVVRDYALGTRPDPHEVECVALASNEPLAAQLRPLASLSGMDLFQEEAAFVAGLRYYAIALQPPAGEEPVYFLRLYSPKKLLRRSPLFAMVFSNGAYDSVTQPLFLFDHSIDCICRGSALFVLHKEHFHEMFRYFEGLRAVARETLETVRARVPIANFDEFARDCEGHLWKLAKLRSIAGKPYLARITMEHIKRAISRNDLAIDVVEGGAGEVLRYDPADPWALLRLLDDDYLWSEMTEQRYEVSGKRELP